MATIYVDPSAAVNGTGTFASPYNTWASVTWAAGNTYLQKAGTTQSGYRILITAGGTSFSNRVIVGSYDPVSGVRTTNGLKRASLNGAGTAQTIRVNQGVNWVWIDNFEVYGTDGTGGSRAIGVYVGNGSAAVCNDIEISNLYVHDIKSDGFADNSDCNGIQVFGDRAIIRNCLIQRIPADAIWLQGSDYKIIDNRITDVSTRSIYGDCIQTNGDAVLRNDRGYIARNYLDHSTKNSKQVIMFGGVNYSSNGLIEDNYCLMADYDGVIGTSCIFVEATNSLVRRNYCKGGYFGIVSSTSGTGLVSHSNICVSNQRGIGTDTTGNSIYNNVIVGSVLQGIEAGSDPSATVKNNVLMNCSTGLRMRGTSIEDNNSFYNNGIDKALASGTANWGVNGVYSNPKLDPKTFRPLPGSPLVSAGAYIGSIKDISGKYFDNPPSIGAYQYIKPRKTR